MLYFDLDFNYVCSQRTNRRQVSNGLDDDFAPNRRQAIIWKNVT